MKWININGKRNWLDESVYLISQQMAIISAKTFIGDIFVSPNAEWLVYRSFFTQNLVNLKGLFVYWWFYMIRIFTVMPSPFYMLHNTRAVSPSATDANVNGQNQDDVPTVVVSTDVPDINKPLSLKVRKTIQK